MYCCQRHPFSVPAPADSFFRTKWENETDGARHTCGRFASHTSGLARQVSHPPPLLVLPRESFTCITAASHGVRMWRGVDLAKEKSGARHPRTVPCFCKLGHCGLLACIVWISRGHCIIHCVSECGFWFAYEREASRVSGWGWAGLLLALKFPAAEYADSGLSSPRPASRRVLLAPVFKRHSFVRWGRRPSSQVLVKHIYSTCLLRRTSPHIPSPVSTGGDKIGLQDIYSSDEESLCLRRRGVAVSGNLNAGGDG